LNRQPDSGRVAAFSVLDWTKQLNATRQDEKHPSACGGCRICPTLTGGEAGKGTSSGDSAGGGEELRGGRLLAWSAAAFVLPVVGAVAGALVAGGGEGRRFVGMAIGLASCMLLGGAMWRLASG
jgi:hypothetical protein